MAKDVIQVSNMHVKWGILALYFIPSFQQAHTCTLACMYIHTQNQHPAAGGVLRQEE